MVNVGVADKMMRFSLHNHTTRYSDCASIDPWELILYSAKAGLNGIVITEHDHQWTDEELAEVRKEALERKLCNAGFLIFAGREVTVNANGKPAHALVFGYSGEIPIGIDLNTLCSNVHLQNAAIVLAHPGRNGKKGIDDFWKYPADGFEYFSQNQDNEEVRRLCQVYNPSLARIGSDDVHDISHIAYFHTVFMLHIKTESDLVNAIKKGKVYPAIFH